MCQHDEHLEHLPNTMAHSLKLHVPRGHTALLPLCTEYGGIYGHPLSIPLMSWMTPDQFITVA
jgi:hypothetical protein